MTKLLLDCVPDELEVDADEDGYVITVPACEHNSMYVTLDCRLDPMPDHGPSAFEFSFCFTINDLDGGALAFVTQDRYEVERYFEDNTREWVMPTVCEAVAALVDHVQPDYIYRVTKGLNLPQKALAKHLMVTDALLDRGFSEAETGTDDYGRTFWLLTR